MSDPDFPFGDWGAELSPRYAELRTDAAPVHRVTTVTGDRMWLITRYDLARQVLSDPRMSLTAALDPDAPRQEPVPQRGPEGTGDAMTALRQSGLHAHLVDVLGPRSVRAHQAWTQRQADTMLAELVRPGHSADLVSGLTLRLPYAVTCRLLLGDLSPDDFHQLNHWCDIALTWSPPFSDRTLEELSAAGADIYGFFLHRLPSLCAAPGPHLIKRLADARTLPDADLAVVASMLLLAGYRTAATFLGGALATLLRHPQAMHALRQQPAQSGRAVEELLRFTPMATGAVKRMATQDVDLDGTTIEAGQVVLVSLEAANRDPRIFSRPDIFDVDRPHRPHLAFGHGKHYCPGNRLARMQITAALRALTASTPMPRLAVAPDQLSWQQAAAFRRLHALPVTW